MDEADVIVKKFELELKMIKNNLPPSKNNESGEIMQTIMFRYDTYIM